MLAQLTNSAAAQPASPPPWQRPSPAAAMQANAGRRAPGALCSGRSVTTQSPLDKVQLPPVAITELTPALAQSAGLVAMVAEDQREAFQAIVVERLQNARRWTPAAGDGYFSYLIKEAGTVRDKARMARGVAGRVGGGLVGLLGGRMMDDVTGSFGMGGQGLTSGIQAGGQAGQLIPTEFAVVPEKAKVIAVVDTLIARPCDYTATDALVALRP